MPAKSKITLVNTLNGVNVHSRQRDGRTDFILSRTNLKGKSVYITRFNTETKHPEIVSYRTQPEAESAAIYS